MENRPGNILEYPRPSRYALLPVFALNHRLQREAAFSRQDERVHLIGYNNITAENLSAASS